MNTLPIPDLLLGDKLDTVNIFFYLRSRGPDQLKLKLDYKQNMICFMIKGRKEIVDDQDRYEMSETQIGLVPKGKVLMNERVTLRQEFESLLMFFTNDVLRDFLAKYDIEIPAESSTDPAVITFPKDPYLKNFQDSMKILEKDFVKRQFRQTKMEELLLYLIEKYPDRTKRFLGTMLKEGEPNSLQQVVQNHKFTNLTTADMAFLCNMSLSTFKRKFQAAYHTSPKKYVIAEKMKKAAQLLQGHKKPSEIYFDLGYENLSSFSNEFKKHFGTRPSSYQIQS